MNERFAELIDIIRDKDDEIYELKKDHLAEIEKLNADLAALEREIKIVGEYRGIAIRQEERIKELEAENEEQKCSDCGIVKEYYSRIKEREAALSNILSYYPYCSSDAVEIVKQALGGGEK